MKNSKSNFTTILAKMETLSESDQGKLKGGFTVLGSSTSKNILDSNYFQCTCSNYNSGCKKIEK